jgi:antitoxin component YwqK of YwqJK toxin-antitoxin module
MGDGIIFKSKDYLHYKAGRYAFLESHENDSKRIVMVEPSDKILHSYDVTIYRDENETLTEQDILMSFKHMRTMENSSNRIILQDWDEDEETCLPTSHHGLIINYNNKKVYNCILSLYDKREEYVFLNDSEIDDHFYPWTYDLYAANKNGIFTERQGVAGYIRWTYVNNQKHGEWKERWTNGQLSKEGYYHLGEPEGEFKEYWGNGMVRYQWNYKNGRRNGLAKYYNREGFLTLEGNYLNDKAVRKWVTYTEKGEFKSEEDYGEKGKPLFFGKDTHGSGFIVCRDCGFEQEITSYLHNLPSDISMTAWTGGYQCQLCGKFQARTSTPEKRDINLTCECGGIISDKEPLFCPKCKSFDLEYHCTMMT